MTPEELSRYRPYAFVAIICLAAAFLYCVILVLEEIEDPQCCADYSGLGEKIHECGNCSYLYEKYSGMGQSYVYGGEGRLNNINISGFNLSYLP